MTNIEKFNAFLQERIKFASTVDSLNSSMAIKKMFNDLFKPSDVKFRLMYAVPDSDREPIQDKDEKPILFNSIEEAKAFRDKNDLLNVHDECLYWISKSYNHSTGQYINANLNRCWIELAE